EAIQRPAVALLHFCRVPDTGLDTDGGYLDGIREHNRAAMLLVSHLGYTIGAIITEGENLIVKKSEVRVGGGLKNQCRSGISHRQAGQPRIHEPVDLFLRGLDEMRNVLAADHHCPPDLSRLERGIGDANASEHSSTCIGDVENHCVSE